MIIGFYCHYFIIPIFLMLESIYKKKLMINMMNFFLVFLIPCSLFPFCFQSQKKKEKKYRFNLMVQVEQVVATVVIPMEEDNKSKVWD